MYLGSSRTPDLREASHWPSPFSCLEYSEQKSLTLIVMAVTQFGKPKGTEERRIYQENGVSLSFFISSSSSILVWFGITMLGHL